MNLAQTIELYCVKVEPGFWSPAPEDVKNLRKKGYKSGMRKSKLDTHYPLSGPPGAIALDDVQGDAFIGDVKCIIRKKGSQYCVLSEDGSKNLGCGNSKEWARKRLAQVEYFKKRK